MIGRPGAQAMRKESGIIGDTAFQIASKKGDTVKRDWTVVVVKQVVCVTRVNAFLCYTNPIQSFSVLCPFNENYSFGCAYYPYKTRWPEQNS